MSQMDAHALAGGLRLGMSGAWGPDYRWAIRSAQEISEAADTAILDDAVAAYQASNTAKTKLGGAVADKLRDYARQRDIGFAPMEEYGKSTTKSFVQKSIRVNQAARPNLAATSLVLAHEGVHRVINNGSIEEELACRELQDDYYLELLVGVTFTSPVTKGPDIAKLDSQGFPDAVPQHKWRLKNQLVDFILSFDIYSVKLTEKWVLQNIRGWGGITNRWATIKGHYVRLLRSDSENGGLVVEILESIKQQDHWNEMLRTAGGVDNLRESLRWYKNAPTFQPRILALQNRWKVDLGARVPSRAAKTP